MSSTQTSPQQGTFEGTLGGRAAKSFRGSVERAGERPYLLLGVEAEGLWLLDVQGMEQEGQRTLTLVLVGPDERRYAGHRAVRVTREGEDWSAALDGCLLSTSKGESLLLAGQLRWRLSPVASLTGRLELELDGRRLPSASSTLAPFNDAWRASAVFLPVPGETCVVDLRLPAVEDGTWQAPPLALHLIWSWTAEDGEVHTRGLNARALEGRGATVESAFSFLFRGELVDQEGATVPVVGRFVGSRA